jgi:exopolysaccharide production protein ExoQ
VTTSAVQLEDRDDLRPFAWWTMFLVCAGVFFVLALNTATSWSEIQRSIAERSAAGFGEQLQATTAGNESGSLHRQIAGVVLGLLGLWALLSPRPGAQLRPRGAIGWLSLAYVAVFVLSVGWADDPHLTGRRVISFVMMVTAVAGLVRLLPPQALVSFALLGTGAYVLIAVVAELATGSFRPGSEFYRFSGVFHPNTLGAYCAFLAMAAVCSDRLRERRWLFVAVLGIAMTVLLLTRSRSGLVGLLLALAARWGALASLSRKLVAVLASAWIACAAFFVAGDAVVPAAAEVVLMSRADSRLETLSGRTDLWDELVHYAEDRPVLGYGLGGFWDARRVKQISLTQRWAVAEAHSTYIELLLDFGLVGLGIYVAVLAGGLRRSRRQLRATGEGTYGFMLCVLVYFLVVGALETLQPAPSFLSFLFSWSIAVLAFREPATSGA